MAQLNRHKEITAKLRSAKYRHVVREYNAAADSLAREALETKMPKVVFSKDWKMELMELNRIPQMIYEPSSNDAEVKTTESGNFV